MKVVVINSLYDPYYRGGAEVRAAADVLAWQKKGAEVIVITILPWQGWKSLKPQSEIINGVKIYRFYPLNIFSFIDINNKPLILRLPWHKLDCFNFHSYFVIKNILQKEKPDLVLTHNIKGLGYLTWLAIKNLKIKNIHTLHDVQLVEPSGLLMAGSEGKVDRGWRKIYAIICRFLIGSPTEVISPSQWLLDFYVKRGFFKNSGKKVDLAFGNLPPVKNLNLKPKKEVINLLYVGQIKEYKGILWLVAILKKLETKNWKLNIVGDGSKLAELKKIVNGDKRFVVYGRQSSVERDKILMIVDFTVVPSLCYENAPMIISESLNKNVPVLASKIGGIGELVCEGVNGYLFKAGDVESWQEVFNKIV